MKIKAVLGLVVGLTVVMAGVTALLWHFGNQAEKPVENVAGERRWVRGEGAVEIVEWSDLQCPACAAAQAPLKEILGKYEGKVSLVYRHLPLTQIHKNALAAAIAVEAAGEQGKFWEMHDLLFSRQSAWANEDEPRGKFEDYAQELGLETERFRESLEKEEWRRLVLTEAAEALRYKVQATPSFFVNGERASLMELEDKIEVALRR